VDTIDQVLNFDCLFPQHTIEFAIPISNLEDVLEELRLLIKSKGYFVNFPVEVRFTPADDIYLSPCVSPQNDTVFCWVGIVMYRPYLKDPPRYKELFKDFQTIMLEYNGRPHWAKAFDQNLFKIMDCYPKDSVEKFLEVRATHDPQRLFENDFLANVFQ
jgi:L-gulonolactone oxidase